MPSRVLQLFRQRAQGTQLLADHEVRKTHQQHHRQRHQRHGGELEDARGLQRLVVAEADEAGQLAFLQHGCEELADRLAVARRSQRVLAEPRGRLCRHGGRRHDRAGRSEFVELGAGFAHHRRVGQGIARLGGDESADEILLACGAHQLAKLGAGQRARQRYALRAHLVAMQAALLGIEQRDERRDHRERRGNQDPAKTLAFHPPSSFLADYRCRAVCRHYANMRAREGAAQVRNF